MLYIRKKKRKRIIKCIFTTIILFIVIIIINIIISNKTATHATFNLAIPKVEETSKYVVCIDPGHGDWDYGAINANGTAEKDIALAISLKLGELLQNDDNFKVIYTRSSDKMGKNSK